MDKTKIACDLVRLHSMCQGLANEYGVPFDKAYSEAVAQAILLMGSEEGAK